jgi:hypothetical protein
MISDIPPKKSRGCVALSQRLGLYIRIIKPKRQRTITFYQPSPSADKSLFVFNPLGIERTKIDWKTNIGE